MRLVAAALAALSGLWLLIVSDGWLLRATALASVVFAGLWTRAVRRVAARGRSDPDWLELGQDHLAFHRSGTARSIALCDVRRVEIDEDRLVVVVCLADGERLTLEPRYLGLTLHDLARVVHEASLPHQPRALA